MTISIKKTKKNNEHLKNKIISRSGGIKLRHLIQMPHINL